MDVQENGAANGFSDDSDDSSGYEQMEELDASVLCLFCDLTSTSVESSIQHCINEHNFNIYFLRDKFKMDYYGYIRLVNYIRTNRPEAIVVNSLDPVVWSGEQYLKPYDPNDPWLWHDLEGLQGISLDDDNASVNPNYVNSENGSVTMTQEHFSGLLNSIKNLNEQVHDKELRIGELEEVIHCIKEKMPVSVADRNASDDASYFNSYSGSHIHWEMLSDTIRTTAYQHAICKNQTVFFDKTVLDVGCGTGILSLMAVSAGAKKVVAVDQSDILYNALEIARENEMLGKIEFIKGKLEEAVLPINKFDIIISEWMGYFLLFEGMLDSVIYARKNFLKKDGIMLPTRCSVFLIGACDIERHESITNFWSDVYGFKMSSMINLSLKEVCIELVKEEDVVTDPCLVHSIDINTVTEENVFFRKDFVLNPTRDATLTQLVGYFDVDFDLPLSSSFSTSPSGPPTHWKHTVFFIREPIQVKTGHALPGHINCYRLPNEVRSLQVDLTISGKKQSYFLT